MTRSFTIRTSGFIGRRRHVRVRIHPDPRAFRAAAHALRPHSDGIGHWEDCWGCFQPSPYRLNTETKETRYPVNGYAGTLRLIDPAYSGYANVQNSFVEIVAHEVVHAAATVYRINVARTIRLGDGRDRLFDHEEEFAYIYGELLADLHHHLY